MEKVFQLLEQVADIKDVQIEKTIKSCGNQLSILNSNLEVAAGMCDSILNREEENSVVSGRGCQVFKI